MTLLYVGGEQLNHIAHGLSVTPTPAADADFGVGFLSDLDPETLFRFGSSQADSEVVADLERVTNGSFGDDLTGWTDESTGGGSISVETASPISGAKSLRCNASGVGGDGIGTQKVVLRADGRYRIIGNVKSTDLEEVRVRLQNLQTGSYLRGSDATWTTGVSEVASIGNLSSTPFSVTFQVEDFATCLIPLTTLKLSCHAVGSGTGNESDGIFDDLSIFPAVNIAVFLSHNLHITPEIRSSTDNFSGSDNLRMTMAPKRLAFYSHVGTRVYERYWKAKLLGQNSASSGIPWAGQWILTDVETITRKQNHGWGLDHADAQSRLRTPSGAQSVTQLGGGERTDLSLDFKHYAESQENEVRDDILARCGYGTHPLLIVPDDTRGDVVLGRLTDRWSRTRRWSGISDSRLEVEGMPYGQMID